MNICRAQKTRYLLNGLQRWVDESLMHSFFTPFTTDFSCLALNMSIIRRLWWTHSSHIHWCIDKRRSIKWTLYACMFYHLDRSSSMRTTQNVHKNRLTNVFTDFMWICRVARREEVAANEHARIVQNWGFPPFDSVIMATLSTVTC